MDDSIFTTRERAFEPGMRSSVGTSRKTPGWDLATERRIDDGKTLARGLGWFSIGLGLAELVAPEQIARWLGMEDKTELVRAYGVREIGTGIGILTRRQPAEWIWARIAGDFLDLATLAAHLTPDNEGKRDNVIAAIVAVAGVTVLDVICARQLGDNDY
jgi:hypothetical protein